MPYFRNLDNEVIEVDSDEYYRIRDVHIKPLRGRYHTIEGRVKIMGDDRVDICSIHIKENLVLEAIACTPEQMEKFKPRDGKTVKFRAYNDHGIYKLHIK